METDNEILKAFEAWVRANKRRFEERGIGVEYFTSEQDKSIVLKQAARVQLDSDDHFSDIKVWDSGEYDVMVLDCETAEYILFDTHVFGTIEEMDSALDDVREYLINLNETGP